MEDSASHNNTKKRARDDSGEFNSGQPELKRVNTETESNSPDSNQGQHESVDKSPTGVELEGGELDSSEARKIPQEILDILDDAEAMPVIQDLDSVIRSFEEEILQASPSSAQPAFDELRPYSGESQPDLGYLLEASDDELGLPPTVSSSEDQAQLNNSSLGNAEAIAGLGNMVGFEDELRSYDSFDLGLSEQGDNYSSNGNGDFVTVDELFDYSEASDFSDFTWRPESLPAL